MIEKFKPKTDLVRRKRVVKEEVQQPVKVVPTRKPKPKPRNNAALTELGASGIFSHGLGTNTSNISKAQSIGNLVRNTSDTKSCKLENVPSDNRVKEEVIHENNENSDDFQVHKDDLYLLPSGAVISESEALSSIIENLSSNTNVDQKIVLCQFPTGKFGFFENLDENRSPKEPIGYIEIHESGFSQYVASANSSNNTLSTNGKENFAEIDELNSFPRWDINQGSKCSFQEQILAIDLKSDNNNNCIGLGNVCEKWVFSPDLVWMLDGM